MIFAFILVFLSCLFANDSVEQRNAITERLNAQQQPSNFYNQDSAEQQTFSATQTSKLNLIERLTKLHEILILKKDLKLPEFQPERIIHPNDKHDSIIILRKILNALGYLDQLSDSNFYDLALEEAVKNFQASHCIEPDGILVAQTVERLNWPFCKRIDMLKKTIDSLESFTLLDKTIIVNIPTYKLYCFENGEEILDMKVIVGTKKRATPTMVSYINALTYYPEWTIPRTIFFKDKLPLIQSDENYFEKNMLQVFETDGEEQTEKNPSEIDWSEIDEHNFDYIIKQKPGKKNALGKIQFNLVNDDQIYLHDTPQKKLFKKYARSFSSGCVRVEKPSELAAWLLDVTKQDVKESLAAEETTKKVLAKSAAVQITYLPMWVEKDGKVLWGDDPYKFNKNP